MGNKQGSVDEQALEVMQKEQIDLGLSCEWQFRRTELNYYCEFYSMLKELNKNLDKLYETMNMLGQDKLMAYFTELTENYKKEEIRVANEQKIKQSHKKKVAKSEK